MTSMVLAPAPHLEPLFLFLKVCILGLFFTSFSVLRFLKPQKFHMYTPFLCIAYPTLPLPLCLWNLYLLYTQVSDEISLIQIFPFLIKFI